MRAAGLRVTGPRLAVYQALDTATATGRHLTAAVVTDAVRTRLGAVSTQAVYDCLEALTAAGLVRRIEPAGHPALYETRVGDNHHHLVCRGCGRTADVDCSHGTAPCLTPADDLGFVVDEAEVVFWGRCADCAASQAPSSDGLRVRQARGPAGARPVLPSRAPGAAGPSFTTA
ncbi:transcriptional repressor [Actinotalea sp. K2]|nr:transcriptional repressor [Actinotalea sp. K2]